MEQPKGHKLEHPLWWHPGRCPACGGEAAYLFLGSGYFSLYCDSSCKDRETAPRRPPRDTYGAKAVAKSEDVKSKLVQAASREKEERCQELTVSNAKLSLAGPVTPRTTTPSSVSSVVPSTMRFDRSSYQREYMRGYMRLRRAKAQKIGQESKS